MFHLCNVKRSKKEKCFTDLISEKCFVLIRKSVCKFYGNQRLVTVKVIFYLIKQVGIVVA